MQEFLGMGANQCRGRHTILPKFPKDYMKLRHFYLVPRGGTGRGADPGFPVGGERRSYRGGASTYDFAKFSQKLHEIEKILGGGGGGRCAPGALPLDPPLRCNMP